MLLLLLFWILGAGLLEAQFFKGAELCSCWDPQTSPASILGMGSDRLCLRVSKVFSAVPQTFLSGFNLFTCF